MSSRTVVPGDVLAARARIQGHVTKTPLMFSPFLSDSADVYIKLENEQITGSFKIRGAYNKMLRLAETDPSSLKNGVITASTGNHGLGCVAAAKGLGCDLEVYSQENVSSSKKSRLEAYGARLTLYGQDCVETEQKARQTAEERNMPYISPYNDPDVAAGQGTIGVEILEDLPGVDVILVAVGGGGLISGIATYVKHAKPSIKVIGCQPINSKVMYESIKAGHIVYEDSLDTLSDSTAGGIEENSITFELCRDYVDDWLMVNEDQIAEAVYFMLDKHHKLVEGSAGVALGAYMFNRDKFTGKTVAIVSCGSNIGMPALKQIINRHCPN